MHHLALHYIYISRRVDWSVAIMLTIAFYSLSHRRIGLHFDNEDQTRCEGDSQLFRIHISSKRAREEQNIFNLDALSFTVTKGLE